MNGLELRQAFAKDLEEETLRSWLGNSAPELFREYLAPSSGGRGTLLLERFRALLGKPGSQVQQCKREGALLALMGFERQEWDSRHFGVGCARLSPYCLSSDLRPQDRAHVHGALLEAGVSWAREMETKVLQRRLLSSRLDEINVLEGLGFHMVDNMVTLAAPIKGLLSLSRSHPGGIVYRLPSSSEHDVLKAMTRGAFPCSRFVNDRVLSAKLGDDLYLNWLSNLLADISADLPREHPGTNLVVAVVEKQIAGYLAYQIDPGSHNVFGSRIASVELIVVDPAYRGRGIGQGLFMEAARLLDDSGVDLLESSTWINQRVALASNQKAGLRVRENMLTYHLYL